jgi:ferrochelatase
MAHGKPKHLLISFHGIPERLVNAGDPYQAHCEQTANLLANTLNLHKNEWTLCYQSQFGYDKWLKPSTQVLFTELPKKNIKSVDVICPGFSVDCLETLEEIAITGREAFLEAGGEELRYIPALNDSNQQIDLLFHLVKHQFSE